MGCVSRFVQTVAMLASVAVFAACSSTPDQSPGTYPPSIQISRAPAGSCRIDAIKMCQAESGTAATAAASVSEQKATMPMPTYGPPNLPESVEFQIPAGQTIKLMCYYDPQHTSVYRADATPDAPLTGNSVEYMKKQGFCVSK